MLSSGMLRRMALVRTDVSEEHFACIIRVERMSETGTALPKSEARFDRGDDTSLRNVGSYKRHIPDNAIQQ
jgi:hypothetical protein